MCIADRDAVVCDFAQYYHLDFDRQPVGYAAVLAAGLPAESRIMTRLLCLRREAERMEAQRIRDARTVTDNDELIFSDADAFRKAWKEIVEG